MAENRNKGKCSMPLSLQRRSVCELLRFSRRIPTIPVQRTVDVSSLIALRPTVSAKVGWCAIFTKAFAIVSSEMPELRRAYLRCPLERLYQHPETVASVAIEREYRNEPGVFYANIVKPEELTLPALETSIQRHRTEPVERIFAASLRFFRLPTLIRWSLWWYLLNVRGRRKAELLGTFAVTALSSLGAESLHPISPVTCTLTYGVITPGGTIPLRIIYDHRVMDGATIARALARMDEVLQTTIRAEMESLRSEKNGTAADVAPAN